MQLEQMEAEQRRKEKKLLQEEWERVERMKQPLLEITPVTGAATELIEERSQSKKMDPVGQSLSLSLPWSEEDTRVNRVGYD